MPKGPIYKKAKARAQKKKAAASIKFGKPIRQKPKAKKTLRAKPRSRVQTYEI